MDRHLTATRRTFENLPATVREITASPFWLSAACFLASVVVLHLAHLPWGSLLVLMALALISLTFLPRHENFQTRLIHLVAPYFLFLSTIAVQPYLAGLFLAGWLFLLSHHSRHPQKWVLRHFAQVICIYEVVALVLLDHSILRLGLNDATHGFTRLFRHAFGVGEINGPELLQSRFVAFSVVAVLAINSRTGRRPWLLGILQCVLAMGLLSIRLWIGMPIILMTVLISACIFIAMTDSSLGISSETDRHHNAPSGTWASGLRWVTTAYLVLVVLGCFGQRLLAWSAATADNQGRAGSILFVNDRTAVEGDEQDMTLYSLPSETSSLAEFEKERNRPRYDKLVHRLLPALGYQVTVTDIRDCRPEDYSRYRLVVLICLQEKLPSDHKQALLAAVQNGSSLLIAGDHTDIHRVQAPFNDVMAPLGVHLNYDSVFPFGQWRSQLIYSPHPVNGSLALMPMGTGGESGYSVGGSLTLNKAHSWPLLEAADGFSDQGTPNAPMYGGLGDSVYTPNETRGGLVLAAERPLGDGTILAFGDTALLQNSSIAHNFAYLSSVFDYLTQRRWHRGAAILNGCSLIAGFLVVAMLFVRRSAGFALACIAVYTVPAWYSTTLRNEISVIHSLKKEITIVDDSHGEVFRHHDEEKGSRVIESLLERTSSTLVLTTNAWRSLASGRVATIVLLAPRGSISPAEQDQLVQFVERGGKLLLASGYYEGQPHAEWLTRFDCQITPLVLGAGQQISVESTRYESAPLVNETWALSLGPDWDTLVSCYNHPVIASRSYGQGRVGVIADSFAILDGTMQTGKMINAESFRFFSQWLSELQI